MNIFWIEIEEMKNDREIYFAVQEIADEYDMTATKDEIKEAKNLMRKYHRKYFPKK